MHLLPYEHPPHWSFGGPNVISLKLHFASEGEMKSKATAVPPFHNSSLC